MDSGITMRPQVAGMKPGMGEMVASQSQEPLLYLRVQDQLEQAIADGIYPSGSRLPSERELAAQLGLSRVTIRRGLREMARTGLIEAAPGSAWFVKPAVIEGPQNALQSFSEMALERGLEASSQVLSATLRPATLDESEILHTAPGAELVELVRLRLLDGIPVAVDACLVPHGRAPGLLDVDWGHASLFAVLAERYECVALRASYSVEAEAVSPQNAKALGLPVGAPVLITIGTTYDGDGRPIHHARTTYRADRYRFNANRILVQPAAHHP
jgi:GntR family transcriptional regulator